MRVAYYFVFYYKSNGARRSLLLRPRVSACQRARVAQDSRNLFLVASLYFSQTFNFIVQDYAAKFMTCSVINPCLTYQNEITAYHAVILGIIRLA